MEQLRPALSLERRRVESFKTVFQLLFLSPVKNKGYYYRLYIEK